MALRQVVSLRTRNPIRCADSDTERRIQERMAELEREAYAAGRRFVVNVGCAVRLMDGTRLTEGQELIGTLGTQVASPAVADGHCAGEPTPPTRVHDLVRTGHVIDTGFEPPKDAA